MNLKFLIVYTINFLFVLIVSDSFSQNNYQDSLWSIYRDNKVADSNKVKALHKIASSYYPEKLDSCLLLKEQEIQFALKNNLKKHAIEDLNKIGALFCNRGDYIKAMDYSFRALKIADDLKDKGQLAECYSCIGVIYSIQSYSEKAFEYQFKALKLREEIGDKGPRYELIAEIYLKQPNFDKALEYYMKDLIIYQKNGDKNDLAWFYSKIGNVYKDKGDYSNAFKYYQKSLKLAKEIKNSQRTAACYSNLSDIYFYQLNFQSALEFAFKALDIWKALNLELPKANCFSQISKIYAYQKAYSKAIEYSDLALTEIKKGDFTSGIGEYYINTGILYDSIQKYNLAIKYFDSSLIIAKKINNLTLECHSNEQLANAYAKFGNYKNAFTYYINFKKLTDSVVGLENSKQLGDFKTQFEVRKKEDELNIISKTKEIKSDEEKKRQRLVIYSVIGVLVLVLIFSFLIYNRFRITRNQKQIIEIKSQETAAQKHLVEEKQKEIIESITYAKRLQEAILPPQEFIDKYVPNNFIIYKPKDLVAGDFYWAEIINDMFFIAAADSTGHGVPGAMVSVVCSNALNRAIKEFNLTTTGKILDKTRELVLETFEKSTSEVKDGMDISLLCIDSRNKNIFWSGANNPLWYVQDNELKEIKADKQPIGKTEYSKPFTTHQIEYKENTSFYLFTDGFADQFGGPNGKKFKYKQFSDLLLKHTDLVQEEQSVIIDKAFTEWKGDLEQVDDVCVIGIKI